jgi:quinol monooxygenase YgiN
MPVVVVATITPAAGQSAAVEAVLRDIIPAVHAEEGCETYALHRAGDKFLMVEKWNDMAALGAHGSGLNVKGLNERLAGLVGSRPSIEILEPVPVGDERKGAV